MVVEVVRQQERHYHQRRRDDGEQVERRRRAPGHQPGADEQAGHERDGDYRRHRQEDVRRMPGDQPGHLLDTERQRYPRAGPGQLRDDHAVIEPAGRGQRERQHRNEESGHHATGEPGRLPGPGQAQHQDDGHRDDRPHLDRAREAERRAAPGQPAAAGQPIAVEDRHGAGQAGEHQPGLQQDSMGGLHAARVHGQDPAGHDDGEQAAMTHKQPAEQHAGAAGRRGQDPRGRHRPGRAGQLGKQRGRQHQQRDPRRLDGDEIAVRNRAVDQAESAAEVSAVVVFGDAEQMAGTGQLVAAEHEPEQGRRRDHDASRGTRDEAPQAAVSGRIVAWRTCRRPHGGIAHALFPTRPLSANRSPLMLITNAAAAVLGHRDQPVPGPAAARRASRSTGDQILPPSMPAAERTGPVAGPRGSSAGPKGPAAGLRESADERCCTGPGQDGDHDRSRP